MNPGSAIALALLGLCVTIIAAAFILRPHHAPHCTVVPASDRGVAISVCN